MAILLDANGKANPNNISDKVLDERESRRRLLTHARMLGCERDMMMLFIKYDKLMRNCSDDKERQDMAKVGVIEMYRLLGGSGELVINGELVCNDKN